MLIVAIIGILANLVAVFLLRGDSKKNINIKAAYLHLLGDTLTSVAVIVGGILIYYFGIYWIDPIITIIIGLYIVKQAVNKLDGKIRMSSDLSVGTKFNITLPNKRKADINSSNGAYSI